ADEAAASQLAQGSGQVAVRVSGAAAGV
ncbi:MAG TPA: glucosamine-6-phosphate deaminase, partial [Arthrobacter bacterium]|nr:glucosamine-6-phosphate deaminase [Arthrobacter sp.]